MFLKRHAYEVNVAMKNPMTALFAVWVSFVLLAVPPIQLVIETAWNQVRTLFYYDGKSRTHPALISVRSDEVVFIALMRFLQGARIEYVDQRGVVSFVYADRAVRIDASARAITIDGKKTRWKTMRGALGAEYVPLEMLKHIGFIIKYEPKNNIVVMATFAIPVLMYHHFARSPQPYEYGATVAPDVFAAHLDALLRAGYTPMSMEELRGVYAGVRVPPKKPIVVTIDDGYESNYTYAYPELCRRRIPATIFVVTSFRGQSPGVIPHFSWAQAKEMVESGCISLGNHTHALHSRTKYRSALQLRKNGETTKAMRARVRNDVETANALIYAHTGVRSIAFSYPYGITNPSIQETIFGTADLYFTTKPGINYAATSTMKLRRINVPGNITGAQLLQKIEDAYFRIR